MGTFFHLRLIPLTCGTEGPCTSWPAKERGFFTIEPSASPDAPSSFVFPCDQLRVTFSHGSFTFCDRGQQSCTRINGRVLSPRSTHTLLQNDILELVQPHNSDYQPRFSFRVDLLSSSSATPQLPGPYSLTPSRHGPRYALMDDMTRCLDDMSDRHPVSRSGSSSSPQSATITFSSCTVTTEHIIPRFPSDPDPSTSGPMLASAVSFRYGDFVNASADRHSPDDQGALTATAPTPTDPVSPLHMLSATEDIADSEVARRSSLFPCINDSCSAPPDVGRAGANSAATPASRSTTSVAASPTAATDPAAAAGCVDGIGFGAAYEEELRSHLASDLHVASNQQHATSVSTSVLTSGLVDQPQSALLSTSSAAPTLSIKEDSSPDGPGIGPNVRADRRHGRDDHDAATAPDSDVGSTTMASSILPTESAERASLLHIRAKQADNTLALLPKAAPPVDPSPSARVAVARIRTAWLHARQAAHSVGLSTASIAVERMLRST
ncbi:unnamed protein product [Tilletia controversa]|nr:unnamed protein product [Tilletia controversa]CAD6903196.1 unnamed protein product [Tilletia controversa]